MMTKLTTPKAVLMGFFFIALSIASLPYSIKSANAELSSFDLMGIENALYSINSSITNLGMFLM